MSFGINLKLNKEIKNYFINNNILVTSICNNQTLPNKELKKGAEKF